MIASFLFEKSVYQQVLWEIYIESISRIQSHFTTPLLPTQSKFLWRGKCLFVHELSPVEKELASWKSPKKLAKASA